MSPVSGSLDVEDVRTSFAGALLGRRRDLRGLELGSGSGYKSVGGFKIGEATSAYQCVVHRAPHLY